jgi:catechol 2,3-dioxygenase-like lactoylglutathione lyase family enzyme
MELSMRRLILAVCMGFLGGCASTAASSSTHATKSSSDSTHRQGTGDAHMRLGNFSVSLAVKDIAASRAFYEKLGLRVVGGDQAKNWLILQNETSTIGLFQGMFPKNLLTFNPGWDRTCATLPDFEDVREIQRMLKSRGLELAAAADESSTGPASMMVLDPDGNPILIDQHVPSPPKLRK